MWQNEIRASRALRRMSAVQDTFVVARKKTSQVTMLEVVVGSHFGFPRTA